MRLLNKYASRIRLNLFLGIHSRDTINFVVLGIYSRPANRVQQIAGEKLNTSITKSILKFGAELRLCDTSSKHISRNFDEFHSARLFSTERNSNANIRARNPKEKGKITNYRDDREIYQRERNNNAAAGGGAILMCIIVSKTIKGSHGANNSAE